jgi:hypothetical protein
LERTKWQWVSLKWPEREPSRFAAGGSGEALKIRRSLSSSNVLRTETVRAPTKLTHYQQGVENALSKVSH